MRRLIAVLCAGVPFAMGANSYTVDNADLVHVSGAGEIQVVNGTEIYRNSDENGSGWHVLFSRNANSQSIEIQAEAGSYDLQIWSIPADQMNPQRQHTTTTIDIGGGGGPGNVAELLAMLGAWGDCPSQGQCTWDMNGDGVVDVSDLLILLAAWEPESK